MWEFTTPFRGHILPRRVQLKFGGTKAEISWSALFTLIAFSIVTCHLTPKDSISIWKFCSEKYPTAWSDFHGNFHGIFRFHAPVKDGHPICQSSSETFWRQFCLISSDDLMMECETTCTPWKLTFWTCKSPYLFEKEHRIQTFVFGFQMLIFRGVSRYSWPWWIGLPSKALKSVKLRRPSLCH